MLRPFLSILIIGGTLGLSAQEKTAPVPRIEKSAPVEMANPDAKPASIAPPTAVTIQGDHDTPPAPQACKGKSGQVVLDCLSREVLAAIRAKMDPLDATSSVSPALVVVTFVINQFGDMKDIRVEYNGTSDLSKKVIVALYTLPKFAPATKDGSNVGTSVKVTYPYKALFEAEK